MKNQLIPTPAQFDFSRTSLRVDCSSSTRKWRRAFVSAVKAIETAVGQHPENRITRSVFDRHLVDLDVDPAAPRQLIFRKVPDLPDFDALYPDDGFGTHLDEATEKELSRLIRRFGGREATVRELSILITDGLIVPGYCGPNRVREIRMMVEEIIEIAEQFGGVESSPVALFYCGIGYTREAHLDVAVNRYGLPEQWFLWHPLQQGAIIRAGEDLGKSARNFDQGVTGTIFVNDVAQPREKPDHGGTQFFDE